MPRFKKRELARKKSGLPEADRMNENGECIYGDRCFRKKSNVRQICLWFWRKRLSREERLNMLKGEKKDILEDLKIIEREIDRIEK